MDGLRAVSIGLVLFAHAVAAQHFWRTDNEAFISRLRGLGVRVFFVISGFLITRILLEEFDSEGRIRGAVIIGVLSYSIYLWQQLFLNHYSHAWPCAFPLNIFLSLAAGFLSYSIVEQPCLRLRKRLEKILFSDAEVQPILAGDRPMAQKS